MQLINNKKFKEKFDNEVWTNDNTSSITIKNKRKKELQDLKSQIPKSVQKELPYFLNKIFKKNRESSKLSFYVENLFALFLNLEIGVGFFECRREIIQGAGGDFSSEDARF